MKTGAHAALHSPKDILILMYHHVELGHPSKATYSISARQFEDHLDLLMRFGFKTINFRQLIDNMENGRILPKRSVLITFDDGYLSFLQHAVPAMQKRGMSATAFLVAGEIGAFNRWERCPEIPKRCLMNESEIEEVIAAGFEIGSHGWRHRDLLSSSAAEIKEEVEHSRESLRDRFQVTIRTFAYPYARYSQEHCAAVADAGFRGAVAFESSASTVTADPFAMRRVFVHAGDTRFRFILKLSPLYLRYRAWRDIAVTERRARDIRRRLSSDGRACLGRDA